MAAAIGTIYGQSPPEMAKELIAIASAANLMTAVFGFHCWQKLVLAGILLEDVGKASCHHGSEAVILKIPHAATSRDEPQLKFSPTTRIGARANCGLLSAKSGFGVPSAVKRNS
jgi:hypothetical protein